MAKTARQDFLDWAGRHYSPVEMDSLVGFVDRLVAEEREVCAKLTVDKSQRHGDCDYRGATDPETGEVPCGRRDGCLCDDLADHGDAIAKAIRERK